MTKEYDLENRTFVFAKSVREYVKKLPKTQTNFEYSSQLIRSSGSVAANYIEANESLSRKDFYMRIKISKKEAKESKLWLNLAEPSKDFLKDQEILINESLELVKIFSTILKNASA
jgi:four helix bundle protein